MQTLTRQLSALTAVAAVSFALAAPHVVLAQEPAAARKPQSEVASKEVKFATVKADVEDVKRALEAKDLEGAKKLVGKEGAFTGTVSRVFSPDTHSVVILNFAKNYREALTAPVRGRDFSKFPDLKKLEGKKVLISGKFQEYQGRTEILLTSPKQVKIIE